MKCHVVINSSSEEMTVIILNQIVLKATSIHDQRRAGESE